MSEGFECTISEHSSAKIFFCGHVLMPTFIIRASRTNVCCVRDAPTPRFSRPRLFLSGERPRWRGRPRGGEGRHVLGVTNPAPVLYRLRGGRWRGQASTREGNVYPYTSAFCESGSPALHASLFWASVQLVRSTLAFVLVYGPSRPKSYRMMVRRRSIGP